MDILRNICFYGQLYAIQGALCVRACLRRFNILIVRFSIEKHEVIDTSLKLC